MAAAKKKAAKGKATVKKMANKAKSAKKTKAPAKLTKVNKPYSKSELVNTVAERTELSKKQVVSVFAELETVINSHLKASAVEKFVMPGLFKVTVKKVPAKKARKGINPFTGEETMFKAKPASKKVKIAALKSLKDMVA